VSRLPVVSGAKGNKTSSEPTRKPAAEQVAATSRVASGHEDILAAIERLSGLHARGILTEAEFSAKKAELLGRLQMPRTDQKAKSSVTETPDRSATLVCPKCQNAADWASGLWPVNLGE
jgi:Short C-terminal domain